ncbi:MAG: LemA family protein [Candidatus Omnitrophota bacterium]|nr:MAG: LemA family protein [Candidatus Omnitrophota bacterium]
MNRISETIKKLFPNDFEELVPVKKHFWQRINLSVFKKGWRFWFAVVSGAFILFYSAHYYNRFVVLETQVLTDKAQIEAQLQRRKDLIINLSKTVIDYAEHERTMFKYMADRRAGSLEKTDKFIDTVKEGGLLEFAKMEASDLEGVLARFMALAEAYPQLKLSSNFQKLMDTLVNIEDRIVERRMAYNSSCNKYGTYIRRFPQKIFAFLFRFKWHPFVKVDKDVELFNRVKY